MKLSLLLLSGAAGALARSTFAGVNIAGFDFGADIQGQQNISSSFGPVGNGRPDGGAQMVHFVQNDGLNTFRLPVTWQFLINSRNLNGTATAATGKTSNGTLDRTNVAQYNLLVRACLNSGSFCIIDIHNYARFEDQVIGQGGPTNAQFANLWAQIATLYRNESKILFGIMNEPHNLPSLSLWADTVQAAVTAIRKVGATTQTILLPGTDFTHASSFIDNGSAGNLSKITNPDGSFTGLVFEVHQYLDSDDSGTALTCVTDRIQDAFMPLAQFLVQNKRKAFLGEIGGGNSTSCLNDLCNALAFINNNTDAYMGYTAWAAGSFSATDYNLTMTPMGSPGSFTDQQTMSQCVVGTRNGTFKATKATGLEGTNSTTTTGSSSPTTSFITVSGSSRLGAEVVGALVFGFASLVAALLV